MLRRVRLGVVAAAAFAAGVCVPVALASAPAGAGVSSVVDTVADTVTDTIEDPIDAPAADIVGMSADSQPAGITLSFKVAKMADPSADKNWLSPLTGAEWQLDIDGDGERDYVVDYYRDEDTTLLTADLDKSGTGHLPDGCEPKPGYSVESGYSVVVDPKCLGGAERFSYRVRFEYITDADAPGADVGTDVSPDQGWTGPVPVELAAGVTPVTVAAPVSTPVAPQQAGGSQAPSTSITGPTSGAPEAGGPRTAPGRTVARPPAGTRSRPTNPAPDGPASAPAPGLARTGLGDRAVRMAWFAVGLGLMGIGLSFANRRPAVRPVPIGRGGRVRR